MSIEEVSIGPEVIVTIERRYLSGALPGCTDAVSGK
jgi:hypothetical protein